MLGLGSLIQNEYYTVEYDSKTGTHDFYSRNKTIKKNFEKVISFKYNDEKRFQYVIGYNDGEVVDEQWVYSNIKNFSKLSLKAFHDDDNKENISPNTISASFSDINKNNDKKKVISLDSFELEEFLKLFFSTNDDLANSLLKLPEDVIKPILISIEGNIGAGKSFLLASMRRSHPEYIFIDEPVEFWESLKNEENESLLEVFYADQRRWSYTFQNCALLSRFKNIENTVNKKKVEIMNKLKMNNVLHGSSFKPLPCVFITERCLETDKEVFAKLLFGSKQLDKLEYKLYETWYNLISEKATKLSAIVYVDTLPDLCADRIKIRSRDGESSIPKEYLCALHEQQDSWIKSTNVPVLRCTSDSLHEVESFISKLIEE